MWSWVILFVNVCVYGGYGVLLIFYLVGRFWKEVNL